MASFEQVVVMRKPTAVIEKPVMQLRDYLVEDQSSCSSNGFKSFPRKRQCCTTTTVRFLLEIDLNNNKQRDNNQVHDRSHRIGGELLRRNHSKTPSASARSVSVLQRASDAVINAVKHLPYRKLLIMKSRFWGSKGRPRVTLAGMERECGPSDRKVELRSFSSSGGESSVQTDDVVGENDASSRKVNNGTAVGEDSSTEGETTITVKEWSNEEEKEQFSPVSILDCPFEDDHEDHDHHTSSPKFHHKLARLDGTKQKILQKIRRFENLANNLEPVDLEKRIATSELEDNRLLARVSVSISTHKKGKHCDKSEEKTRELIKLVKSRSNNSNLCYKVENLMFDYFEEIREIIIEESSTNNNNNEKKAASIEREGLKAMEDWVNGETREVLLGWEVKEGRYAYLKDMERDGKSWKLFDDEREEVALDLEAKIWDSLVHELLLDDHMIL